MCSFIIQNCLLLLWTGLSCMSLCNMLSTKFIFSTINVNVSSANCFSHNPVSDKDEHCQWQNVSPFHPNLDAKGSERWFSQITLQWNFSYMILVTLIIDLYFMSAEDSAQSISVCAVKCLFRVYDECLQWAVPLTGSNICFRMKIWTMQDLFFMKPACSFLFCFPMLSWFYLGYFDWQLCCEWKECNASPVLTQVRVSPFLSILSINPVFHSSWSFSLS